MLMGRNQGKRESCFVRPESMDELEKERVGVKTWHGIPSCLFDKSVLRRNRHGSDNCKYSLRKEY